MMSPRRYKELLLVVVFAVLILASFVLWRKTRKPRAEDWEWALSREKIYSGSPAEINSLLRELRTRFPKKEARLRALALLRLGTPYGRGKLGEEKPPDEDPLFRVDVTDCTAFILTQTALVNAKNLEEAEGLMKPIGYRPEGDHYEVSFDSRLHFVTDRLQVSPYFENITEEAAGKERTKTEKVVLNKKRKDGTRLLDIAWEKEAEVHYVPSQKISGELLNKLPPAVGLAFVNKDSFSKGLDVVHEGLLFSQQVLIHASSRSGKVESVNFEDYYFKKDGSANFDGLVVFDLLLSPSRKD